MSFTLDISLSAALRFFLFYATPLPALLERRLELSTPFTSIAILRESLATESYDRMSPLLTHSLSYLNHPLFWNSIDILTAVALRRVSKRCARWYLYNPLTVITTLAQSSVSVQNALVLTALAMACQKRAFTALFLLSTASVLFLYPAALLPPLLMVLWKADEEQGMQEERVHDGVIEKVTKQTSQSSRTPTTPQAQHTKRTPYTSLKHALIFSLQTISLLSLSRYFAGDWSFVHLYSSLILVTDLTPNTGLFWYLLVEMFEQFKGFFTAVLQAHTVVYVPSVCIFLSHRPTLAYTFLAGTLAIFKSYPCMADVNVLVALLPLFSDLFEHARHPVFVAALTVTAAGLLPLFRYLWLRVVTGNANFYYASTLLWTFSNGLVLTELLYAEARRMFVERQGGVDTTKYEIRQV
ncbi:hypothetical protein E3P99_01579 [Wallemia hederae]|uniref:GPI transamidase component PIG-U n=1 Tax=Wallemia hederae TaxID=1540922 RepID=A0A4T0FPU6_9BASI|nr:hypothetical protein E3P99_01579 [Wallemia hederae]